MKRQVVLLLIAGAVAALALWQAAAALLVAEPPAPFHPLSFDLAPGSEPISPIPRSLPLDARKIALGKRLFHDKRLSRDNSIACASCHDLRAGGVDGRQRSLGVGGQLADLNAPTVFNSVFNFRQFWDGRAATLEEQIDGPVYHPNEMASNWPEILAKLSDDREFATAFRDVYGRLAAGHLKNAIAEFERSLLTPGSRFDRYLQGERDALTRDELQGYQLFKSYGCVACHQGVNVGGNLYQRLGVMSAFFRDEAHAATANRGRAAVTGKTEDLHVFKVPGLRNVALTGPYFHDGSVPTLEEAVLIMGQYQLGVVIPSRDVGLIIRFLHTLTGEYRETPP
jgi:cytochrome c peroxidase